MTYFLLAFIVLLVIFSYILYRQVKHIGKKKEKKLIEDAEFLKKQIEESEEYIAAVEKDLIELALESHNMRLVISKYNKLFENKNVTSKLPN